MQKLWIWFAMLSKRLYKQPAFVVLLILIPALVLGFTAMAGEESGVLRIALSMEDSEDLLAKETVNALQRDNRLITFVLTDAPQELVRTGKVDAAWVFPGNMGEKVAQFVSDGWDADSFVTVYQREDDVSLVLAREKLAGALYRCCASELYIRYLRENYPQLADISRESLMTHFDEFTMDGTLFRFEALRGEASGGSFLLTPMRGLLAVVAVLCGIAASMYYLRSLEVGTFSWVSQERLIWVELACQAVAALAVTAVCGISLALANQGRALLAELSPLLLYSLCICTFSMVIRRLCGKMALLSAMLPLLAVIMCAVCPVFFQWPALHKLQLLLPPTYYILSGFDSVYLLWMLPYAAACFAISSLWDKLLIKR